MISALERVGSPHGTRQSSWRHFGTEARTEFLRAAAADPAVGRRLRALLRRAAVTSAVLLVAAAAVESWKVAADFGAERVRVDLRLGEYARAQERAERLAEDEPDLARLVARAGAHRDGAGADAFLAEARAAAERGDEEAARDYVELAVLRGARRAELDALRTGSR